MSKISTGLDAIKTRLGIILPDHIQLSNPYDVEENTDRALNLGWGLGVGSGLNSERHLSCKLSIRRQIIIPITRRIIASELGTTRKETSEKNLLEDQFLVIDDLEKDPTVNNSNVISSMKYVSDGGIIGIARGDGKNDAWRFIRSIFQIEYFEDLTT